MPYQSLAPDGKFLYVNEAWVNLLGYSAEDIAGKSFGDIILPELYEKFCEKFEEFKNEGIIIDAELILLAKSGKEIAVKIDGRFVKDEIGNYLHTHCILKDITTEYNLRKEIKKREGRRKNVSIEKKRKIVKNSKKEEREEKIKANVLFKANF